MDTVFINGRFLTGQVTGVQRYSREVVNQLDRLLADGEISPQDVSLRCLAPPEAHLDEEWQQVEVRRTGKLHGNLWEQTELPFHSRSSLLFSPANIGPYFHPRQVVTIHDASVFAIPQAYRKSFRLKYGIFLRRLVRIARKVITVSEFSKQELVRWVGADPEKIVVIPHGHEHFLSLQPDTDVLDRFGLVREGYLLCVASRSGHKNLAGMMEAYCLLPEPKPRLVIAGGRFGRVFSVPRSMRIPEGVVLTGFISDASLRALFDQALGFVFPSFYEGFGFPILEAFSANCPVICSNTASLPEVAGDAALYFDPNDHHAIAQQMSSLIDSATLRTELRAKGQARLAQFTWKECARRTWEVLASAI